MRDDAIMATGRSDYPNQVNNVLGFPYIFRGALDVRATTINMEMKIAAARRSPHWRARTCPTKSPPPMAPAEVRPRLHHPRAVRSAADFACAAGGGQGRHGHRRGAKADRGHGRLQAIAAHAGAIRSPACCSRCSSGCAARPSAWCSPRAKRSRSSAPPRASSMRGSAPRCWSAARSRSVRAQESRHRLGKGIEIINAALSKRNPNYVAYLYERLQRQGYLLRDVQRLINTGPQQFRRLDAGARRRRRHGDRRDPNYSVALEDVRRVIDPEARPPRHRPIDGAVARPTVLVADTAITEMPTAEELAEIAVEAAGVARRIFPRPLRPHIRALYCYARSSTRSGIRSRATGSRRSTSSRREVDAASRARRRGRCCGTSSRRSASSTCRASRSFA